MVISDDNFNILQLLMFLEETKGQKNGIEYVGDVVSKKLGAFSFQIIFLYLFMLDQLRILGKFIKRIHASTELWKYHWTSRHAWVITYLCEN